MGFFNYSTAKPSTPSMRGLSVDFAQKHGCRVCPLAECKNKSPDMAPLGSSKPVLYFLGDFPDEIDDRRDRPFAGEGSFLIHQRIPNEWRSSIRYNNIVRTAPPVVIDKKVKDKDGNVVERQREPADLEIECCRPSIVADIERTKPFAIFGFGNGPLRWIIGERKITPWAGRYFPIKIGSHTCWYFPMRHPREVIRLRRWEPKYADDYPSNDEFAFHHEFKRAFAIVDALPDAVVETEADARSETDWVTGSNHERDLERIQKFLDEAAMMQVVGFDYETNRLRPYNNDAKLLTVAMSIPGWTFGFPFEHPEAQWTEQELDQLWDMFTEFLLKAQCTKAVHQLAFEMEWTAVKFGRKTLRKQPWADTIAQAYLLDERQEGLSLDFMCRMYFGINIKALSDVDRARLEFTPLDTVLSYNCIDAKYHRKIYWPQYKRLKAEKLMQVYRNHMRRIPTVVLTQVKGVPVDQKTVMNFATKFERIAKEIETDLKADKAVKEYERRFNKSLRPSNLTDLRQFITKVLGKQLDKTLKEDDLKRVDHPAIDLVLEWRKNNKVLSTYVDPLRAESEHIFDDGLLHPVLSLTRVVTWRTSSEDPNIQNFPKRNERVVVRKQVKGRLGQKIVAIDYAGIQARNVAMESEDPALVDVYWTDYDIHKDWMVACAELDPKWVKEGGGAERLLNDKDVAKSYRHLAKNKFVFPSFFGAHPKSIAPQLGVHERVAEELQEQFWGKFSHVKEWQDGLRAFFKQHGYVTGLSGFKRRAPIGQNQLINAPIQADEALIVIDAMSRISELEIFDLQPNMEIHDDLTWVWSVDDLERNIEEVVPIMVDPVFKWINVPIVVEVSVGDDWSKLEEIGKFTSDGMRWSEKKK